MVLWSRLGWLIRFISHSIISGFTTGAAIIIGFSQIKDFLGYEVTTGSKFIPLVRSIIAGWSQVSCSNHRSQIHYGRMHDMIVQLLKGITFIVQCEHVDTHPVIHFHTHVSFSHYVD